MAFGWTVFAFDGFDFWWSLRFYYVFSSSVLYWFVTMLQYVTVTVCFVVLYYWRLHTGRALFDSIHFNPPAIALSGRAPRDYGRVSGRLQCLAESETHNYGILRVHRRAQPLALAHVVMLLKVFPQADSLFHSESHVWANSMWTCKCIFDLWGGICNFNFKLREDGSMCIFEVNPRARAPKRQCVLHFFRNYIYLFGTKPRGYHWLSINCIISELFRAPGMVNPCWGGWGSLLWHSKAKGRAHSQGFLNLWDMLNIIGCFLYVWYVCGHNMS